MYDRTMRPAGTPNFDKFCDFSGFKFDTSDDRRLTDDICKAHNAYVLKHGYPSRRN